MPVSTRELPEYTNIKLDFKRNKYPVPDDINLPRLFFVGLFVGSRGSGKTFSIVELLKQYERYGIYDAETKKKVDQRIVVFSPTHDSNPVFSCLKHLSPDDVISSYSDAKLLAVVTDVRRRREETLEYQKKLKIFEKFRKCKSIDELEAHEVFHLELHDFAPPAKPDHPNGCVTHFVLDDLVGSTAFKAVGKSALTNLVLKNTHLAINILVATQNLKAIPKSIRTNTSVFVVFRFASMKIILEDLYTEVSNTLTLSAFEELYDFATRKDNSALIVDFTQPKEDRFKQNWSTVLTLE